MPLVPLDSFGEVRGVDFGSTTVPPSGLQGLQHNALELLGVPICSSTRAELAAITLAVEEAQDDRPLRILVEGVATGSPKTCPNVAYGNSKPKIRRKEFPGPDAAHCSA